MIIINNFSRSRYHSSPEEVRLRTHQDRSRDRYYDRDRDRGRDRGKDRSPERSSDRDRGKAQDSERTSDRDRGRSQDSERSSDRDSRGRSQDSDRQERPYSPRLLDREREADRLRSSSRTKDLSDGTEGSRRPNSYDRTTEKTITTTSTTSTTTTTTCLPEQLIHKSEVDVKDAMTDRLEKPSYPERPSRPTQTQSDRATSDIQDYQNYRNLSGQSQRTSQQADYHDKDLESKNEQNHQITYTDEYSSEYYDEPLEDPSPPPTRTAIRIVKRPFLPSRGGNSNPRGLLPVGSKAPHLLRKEEETTTDHRSTLGENEQKSYYVQEEQEDNRNINHQESLKSDNKQYDVYKAIQSDLQKKQQQDEYDTALFRPVLRRPIEKHNEKVEEEEVSRSPEDVSNSFKGYSTQNQSYDLRNQQDESLTSKWTEDYSSGKYTNAGNVPTGSPIRSKVRAGVETTPNYSSTYKNEDIPDHLPSGPGNNYRAKQRINEVTHRLQDIPESEYDVTLNDALTPTLVQEANLPSGFVLPIHRQHLGRDAVLQPSENNYKLSRPINHQQQHPHQQKSFVPSPPFLATSLNNNDQARTMYYRTPEAIQISGAQYRQQRQWQDYTVY